MTAPYETDAEELKAERENSYRLVAALRLAMLYIDDATRHCVIGPPHVQLTLGQVLDGAVLQDAAHDARRGDR